MMDDEQALRAKVTKQGYDLEALRRGREKDVQAIRKIARAVIKAQGNVDRASSILLETQEALQRLTARVQAEEINPIQTLKGLELSPSLRHEEPA